MYIRLNIIAFTLGVILLQQQAVLPNIAWMWVLSLVVMPVLLLRDCQSPTVVRVRAVLLPMFFLGIGFFWAAACAHWRLADTLPHEWERRDIQITGVVASLPKVGKHNVRFQFNVEQVLTQNATVPKHISLSWYVRESSNGLNVGFPQIKVGERWQLTVRLKRPHGNINPFGFDYEAWALQRNIRASGYVRYSKDNQLLNNMVYHPAYWTEQVRQNIRERFELILPNAAHANVLTTLAIGDQQGISPAQWHVLTRTGTNHLMAISGLHITLVSGLIFALTYWLWCRLPSMVLRLPARRAAVIVGLCAALIYALLSGFAVPAQRAFCMLMVVAVALWRGQITSPVSILLCALLSVVIWDPWSVLAPGFWLSFGAVAIILWVTVGRIGVMHWLPSWLWIQFAITLGLIPLLLGLFQQVSLVSFVANVVAIPLVSLIVVPFTLLATLPGLDFCLIVAQVVLNAVMQFLDYLSDLPQAVWQQHTPPLWAILVGVVGVCWTLLPGNSSLNPFSGFPARWLGFVALTPLFLVPPARPNEGELWVTVLDVGQGLAVVARTARHTLLFDSGPAFGERDSGDAIIVPFLKGSGIRYLDAMIVSHADSDHSGGALSVLEAIPVSQLISSLGKNHPIQLAASKRSRCQTGDTWSWDGVSFEVLHPHATDYHDSSQSINALSCVLKITTEHGSVLLPADIDKQAEQLIISRSSHGLISTVLIAPHHGSKSSSSYEFIERVNPDFTIFTMGYRNRFGHPAEEVINRYRVSDSQLFRTDQDGAISLKFEHGLTIVKSWRKQNQRYWQ